MANWRDEYCAALAIRDETEKANVALYDAYTRLADRTSRTSRAVSSSGSTQPARPTSTSSPGGGSRLPRKSTSAEPTTSSLADLLAVTRSDLSEAQRSRAELQDRLARTTAELEKIRKKNVQDTRRITALEGERTHLTLRLKDRDEELKGKAKLLEDFQDELASLNLQLNMAEEQSNRLKKENKELIDRWMARMGREADAMNDASRF